MSSLGTSLARRAGLGRLPALFLSHGSPMLAVQDSPAGRFLDGLGAALAYPPRAIVIASAHHESPTLIVGVNDAPDTMHDFGGFPPELYQLQYPTPGDPALAARVIALARSAGIEVAFDADRGLDHGAWVPLRRIFPLADIPVVPISVSREARTNLAVGHALQPLRDEGVLVIGSGGFVHNLRELDWRNPQAEATPWSTQFTDWMRARIAAADVDALLDWQVQAPHAARAHPTPEHLMPLFVALGAAGAAPPGRVLHRSHEFGSLALDALAFD